MCSYTPYSVNAYNTSVLCRWILLTSYHPVTFLYLCPTFTPNYGERKKPERQCKYNVTMRRVRESLLPYKSNKYYLLVCACVRVGTRARGRMLDRTFTLLMHHVTSFVAPQSLPYFSTLSHKRCDLRKKVTDYKMCVLTFSTNFV
jgi:hypothetical protein